STYGFTAHSRAASPILKYGLSGIPEASVGIARRATVWDPSIVEDVLQDLARLEGQHPSGADGDLLPRLRVSTRPRVLVAHDEISEVGDLDLLPALQRLLDRVEHGLDDLGGLLLGKTAYLLVDVLDNVGLRHSFFVYRKTPFTSMT